MRRFFAAGALMTVVALAAATAASAAVPSPSYQLGGIALGTSYFGSGIGSTGDRASWQATIRADAAGAMVGTFSLRSSGQQLTGTVSGGQMSAAAAAPGCGRQTLDLNATVATADGPMTLTGTVTQFRIRFGRVCFVLASSVQATLAAAPAEEPPPPPDDPGGQL